MKARLRELLAQLPPDPDVEVDVDLLAERLAEYGALVQRYGARINLVGARDDAFVAGELIGGSLQLLRVARPRGRLVDVGSGAGLPGIPLALACPGLAVTLVESRQKRAAFLRRARALLRLEGVVVDDRDVHELIREGAAFDWAVARAFKPPEQWLRLGASLVRPHGRLGVYTTKEAWRATPLADGLRVAGEAADPTGPGRLVAVVEVERR
jgi:16S rRNA (guanine527-N7)-methyltransferase